MDKRLDKLQKELELNFSVDTIKIIEEYLEQNPNISYQELKSEVLKVINLSV